MQNTHCTSINMFMFYVIIVCCIVSSVFPMQASPLLRKHHKTKSIKIELQQQQQESDISNKTYSHLVLLSKCSVETCAGECVTSSKCSCLSGYVNLIKDKISNKVTHCSYKQKSQLTAFFLETFLPFGVGHFYCNRIIFGLSKMSIFFLPIFSIISAVCGLLFTEKCFNSTNSSMAFIAIFTLFFLVSFAWWIADIITFGFNMYLDGNDVPLASW